MKKVVALFFVALLFTLGMYSTAFSASHMKVALVIAGELGDKSFYDSSYQLVGPQIYRKFIKATVEDG